MTQGLVIADAFCGAGGSSEGLRRALADRDDVHAQLVAINHWPAAITNHQANHPDALHHCADLTKVSLGKLVPGGRVDAVWLSPSCSTHSYARHGKSIDEQMRAGAWVTQACAEIFRPRLIIVENVPPFTTWGPLDARGRPIKSRRGETFRAWLASLEALGFRWTWELLNAADFGAPQTRVRFFLAAVRGGRAFAFPEPTHSRTGETTLFGRREKWRGAREILDSSLSGGSITSRRKPLSAPTLRRMAHGARAYWGGLALPALATIDEAARAGLAEERTRALRLAAALKKAERTAPAASRTPKQHERLERLRASVARSRKAVARFEELLGDLATWGVDPQGAVSLATLVSANRTNNAMRSETEPMPPATTTSGGGLFVAEPRLHPLVLGQQSNNVARDVGAPLPTIATAGKISISEPALRPIVLGQHGGGAARDVAEPLSTIATKGAAAIVEPMVVVLRNVSPPRSVGEPMATVAAGGGHHALAEPVVLEVSHEGERRARTTGEPLPTLTAKRNVAVAEPFVTSYYGESDAGGAHPPRTLDEPLPTVVTANRFAIAEPFIVAHFGERAGQTPRTQQIDEPVWTVTNRGAGDLVAPAIVDALGDVRADRLVVVDGALHLFDVRFRMLQPHELQLAQGFPPGYKFVGTKEQQTRMIGNAVEVNTAAALWRSALALLLRQSNRGAA